MMRSLSSAVGGLRSHQTKMDVIGNNIANVNTYGFKSGRATFSDVYYQTLSGASSPNGNVTGGTNPTQIGYGASVATIDVLNTQSGSQSTDRALDIYIGGDGMIVTKDAKGNLQYSRLGLLGFDAEGNLVDGNGNFVMGFPMDASTNTPIVNPDGSCDVDKLSIITCENFQDLTNISIGTSGEIIGVLAGDSSISKNNSVPKWLTNVTMSNGAYLTGDVSMQLTLDQSVVSGTFDTSTTLDVDWINKVTAAAGGAISGNYTFTYNQVTEMITATGPNGEIYTGQYKKGSNVVLRKNGDGDIGFTVNTSSSNTPPTGSSTSLSIGNVSYELKDVVGVTAVDQGGKTYTQYQEFDKSTLGTKDYTFGFGDAGSITLTIDTNNVTEYEAAVLAYDATNDFATGTNVWLGGANYQGSSTYSAGGDLIIELQQGPVVSSVNVAGTALGFLDTDQFKTFLDGLGLTATGGYYVDIIQDTSLNPSGDYRLAVVAPNGTTVVASSNIFTQGAGGTLELFPGASGGTLGSGTVVGSVPNATTSMQTGRYDNRFRVSIENTVLAGFDDGTGSIGTLLGSTVYDGSSTQVVIKDPEGNNIVLDISSTANLLKAFAETTTPSAPPIPTSAAVGTVSQKFISDLDYNGKIASVATSDGESFVIGNIVLGRVPNAAAMLQKGDSYFITTANSGEASFIMPGLGGTGNVKAGYLEMSNVDISKEFTDMITTQRGFQANTRIITVSDEMLNELVNLKR